MVFMKQLCLEEKINPRISIPYKLWPNTTQMRNGSASCLFCTGFNHFNWVNKLTAEKVYGLEESQVNCSNRKKALTHREWSGNLRLFHYWLKTLKIQVNAGLKVQTNEQQTERRLK